MRQFQIFKKHISFIKKMVQFCILLHKILKCKYSVLSTDFLNHLGERLSKNLRTSNALM